MKLDSKEQPSELKPSSKSSFAPIVERCDIMIGNLAALSGTQLKDLIYELFPTEVGDAPLRSQISQ